MVYRIYVEKKEGFDHEAKALLKECRELLELRGVENIRLLNRYDVEDIEETLFRECPPCTTANFHNFSPKSLLQVH